MPDRKLPVCDICQKNIYRSQFRLKIWDQDVRGNTNERRYVHASHLVEAYHAANRN